MKTFKRRDSATALLRKMGVARENYNNFINEVDGQFFLDDERAALSLQVAAHPVVKQKIEAMAKPIVDLVATPAEEATLPLVRENVQRRPAIDRSSSERGATITCVAEQLILQGRTNQEVWEVIQPMFQLDTKKKHYPSWYRSRLIRAGKLPPK
jgi:hypothetical protein